MLKAGNYSDSTLTDERRNRLFVETVESIMSTEHSKYISLRQQKSDSGFTKN
jgi:hypothetical protein